MLENEDIQKIIAAQKEIFPAKEEFQSFKNEILKIADKIGIRLEY